MILQGSNSMAIAVARAPSMPGLISGENRTPGFGIQCVVSANELKQSTRVSAFLQCCPLFATHLHSNTRRKCGRLVIVCGAGDKLFNQQSSAAFQAGTDKFADALGITACARGLSQIETHKPERGSSVRTNAGRNKKWRTLEKGRLEGNKRTRGNENTRKPKAPPPPPSPGPGEEGDANESEAERPAKEPRVKPRKGPKPKERVTFAGQDMLLLNMGDRNKVGGEVEPWASVRTERMPDDYYKYGPFGPHAWKGVSVGTPRKGTLCDNLVVFFSTVENEEEHDLEDIQDAITGYAKRLDHMDEALGIQYYFVFVRQVAKVPNLAPWEEWTLVAQVAVESESELEKWSLGSRLDRSMWRLLTRCVAWYRPDLVYVKKPAYQVRFEPQKEFIEEWVSLLDSGNASSDYYERLCELLGVEEKEDAEQAAATFDGFDEERKGKCIEHVLTSHPVCLLTPFTQEAFEAEKQEKTTLSGELDSMEAGESSDTDDEDEADEEFDPFTGEFGEEIDFGEAADDGQFMGKEWEREEAMALAAEEAVQKNSSLTLDADEEAFKAEIAMGSTKEQDADTEELEPFLDAALRPFTYTNLIKEIFIMRSAMVEFAELSG